MKALFAIAMVIVIAAVLWLGLRSTHVERQEPSDGLERGASRAIVADDTPANSSAEVQEPRADVEPVVAEEAPEETDRTQVPFAGVEVNAERTWPVDPEAMNNIVLSAFARAPNPDMSSLLSSRCTPTVCEVRYIARSLAVLSDPNDNFPESITGPPYNATFKIEARTQSTGADEVTITFMASPPPPPTTEEARERMRSAAEQTRYFASNALPPGSYGSPPVIFGNRGGADQFVEDICGDDCPLDGRRVIYLGVPEGRSCSEFDGVEQTLVVRSRSGAISEKTYCVPRHLVEF